MRKLFLAFCLLFAITGIVPAQKIKKKQVAAIETTALKADGTPDKRFKANKSLKKDGTPDMRFTKNKKKKD